MIKTEDRKAIVVKTAGDHVQLVVVKSCHRDTLIVINEVPSDKSLGPDVWLMTIEKFITTYEPDAKADMKSEK